jgi:hypothetical protein
MEKDSSTENKVLSNKLKDHFKDNIKLAIRKRRCKEGLKEECAEILDVVMDRLIIILGLIPIKNL